MIGLVVIAITVSGAGGFRHRSNRPVGCSLLLNDDVR
jgi:hypothetical protein